ncbi:unnamed protein product, partial [Acanthocheilonema viteae]
MFVTVLLIFFGTVNVQCEREYQTVINPSQNPFQQSRNVGGSIVISGNQQPIDRNYSRTAIGCNPGDIAPTGDNCTAYYECINGYYKLRFCPTNTFFNPTLKRCHADYVCPNRAYKLPTSPLSPCKYGELRADERSCENYYSCAGSDRRHFERRTCPAGTIFDRTLNRCISNTAGNKCQQSIQQE